MYANSMFDRVARVAEHAALALSTGVAVAGCGGGADAAPNGARGQSCYPNQSCNAGLVCKNDRCIDEPNGGTGSSGVGGASSVTISSSGSGGAGGGSGGGSGKTGASSSSSTGGSGGAPPANQPPVFLSFGTNVSSITQGQMVTISAVLTDPDGIDDIIGGTLLDGSGATYGAFATSGEEGAYELSVSWDQFNQVTSIDFDYGSTKQRVLKAQFFDQAGHSVEQSTSIKLTCNGDAACDGTCIDTKNSASNCGSCGHVCPDAAGCYEGKCGKLSGCLPKAATCAAACAAKGKVCQDLCGDVHQRFWTNGSCSGGSANSTDCNGSLAGIGNNYSESCCCF